MTTINYLTYDFSNYNDVFQILDYKQLLPLSHLVDYDMLFNEYDSNIGTPTDLINYLNKIDPSILTDICSFLNSIPNNIQTRQNSAINWQCPGTVTVISGRQRNIRLLGETNQINNKVKVLFLIARAYCHQNYCGQLVFNHYDLWDKYWGPGSHSLFPEQVDCSNIDITSEYDTITIKDNNTYTYGYERDYLIKIVRTDLKHEYFKSTNYIILKQKEQIKLTSLVNGIYEISIAISYTNEIDGINDYVWSEFCTSTVQPKIKLTIPGYLQIDNEVYWEYHFVLPADHPNTKGGLSQYFDKYQGKMRNYFLTWWKETADSNLDNGSDTLGGASLENCSYDLRYTTEKPKKDSIWIYYNNISFKSKTNYTKLLPAPGDDPPFQDLNTSDYQKITVLGYQNIWVQMRVRNQIGVPDWPITDGYPTGLPLNIYNAFGDELYGYQIETNTPPYFKNVLVTDSNCEYPYTVGTFSWGAPADTMSPVQSLAALSNLFKLNFAFNKPTTWWATQYDDNTSDYQKNHKPNINPLFLIFPLINTIEQLYTELDYTSKINRHINNSLKNYSTRPYFIFTNEDFIQLTKDEIPQYQVLLSNNTAYPKKCYYNKLPTSTGFNFIDGRTYKSIEHPCTTVTLSNNSNGYYRKSTDSTDKRPYIQELLIAGHTSNLKYDYESESATGKIFIDFSDISISESLPESPVYIGMKVLNYNDLRITNHRYPYDHTLSAIKIPPFNIEDIGSPSPESPLQIMNTDVQYSIPIPIPIETPSVEHSFITYTYTDNIVAKTITVTFSDVFIADLTGVKINVYTICIEGNPMGPMWPTYDPVILVSNPTPTPVTYTLNVDGKIILDNTNQDYGSNKSNIFYMECKYLDTVALRYYTFKNTEQTNFVISNFTLNLSTMSTFRDKDDPVFKGNDYTSVTGVNSLPFKSTFLSIETYYDSNELHDNYVLDLHWPWYLLEKKSDGITSPPPLNYFTNILKQISINNLNIYFLYIKFLNDNILFNIDYLKNYIGLVSTNVAIGINIGPSPIDSGLMYARCPNIPTIQVGSGGRITAIRALHCSLYFSTDIFSGNNNSKVTQYTILNHPPPPPLPSVPPSPPPSPPTPPTGAAYVNVLYPIPI